jgi:OOP family OmpA-OmpF porin
MLNLKSLGVVALMGLLAGCTTNIQAMKAVEATGSPFTKALAEEYRQIVTFEADQMYDWPDADYFAQKGLKAAAGEVVQPEELANWDLPAEWAGDLAEGRNRLMVALESGARDSHPDLAARAQGRFDCWIEQAEENHQPDHIAACRNDFYSALEQLEAAMKPAAAQAEAAPAMPSSYIVYFDFDKSNIRPDGQTVVDQVVSDANKIGTPPISVTGHADRAGAEDYNMALSLRRADAVRDALIKGGVAADQITTAGRGEDEPAVPTADGVREQANRRVEIIIQQ